MRACVRVRDFPSFSEGLSLREIELRGGICVSGVYFPSFSEGLSLRANRTHHQNQYENGFPFLFGGTFIEGVPPLLSLLMQKHFPSFSEGLSLRGGGCASSVLRDEISLPFRRDFH